MPYARGRHPRRSARRARGARWRGSRPGTGRSAPPACPEGRRRVLRGGGGPGTGRHRRLGAAGPLGGRFGGVHAGGESPQAAAPPRCRRGGRVSELADPETRAGRRRCTGPTPTSARCTAPERPTRPSAKGRWGGATVRRPAEQADGALQGGVQQARVQHVAVRACRRTGRQAQPGQCLPVASPHSQCRAAQGRSRGRDAGICGSTHRRRIRAQASRSAARSTARRGGGEGAHGALAVHDGVRVRVLSRNAGDLEGHLPGGRGVPGGGTVPAGAAYSVVVTRSGCSATRKGLGPHHVAEPVRPVGPSSEASSAARAISRCAAAGSTLRPLTTWSVQEELAPEKYRAEPLGVEGGGVGVHSRVVPAGAEMRRSRPPRPGRPPSSAPRAKG